MADISLIRITRNSTQDLKPQQILGFGVEERPMG